MDGFTEGVNIDRDHGSYQQVKERRKIYGIENIIDKSNMILLASSGRSDFGKSAKFKL